MKINHRFHDIIIVESLRDADLKTGQLLCNKLLSEHSIKDAGVKVSLIKIVSGLAFLSFLDVLGKSVKETGRIPILHLEFHGDDKGFQFTDDSILNWEDLKQAVTSLNIILRNQLVVTVAACSGAYLSLIIMPTDRSPVFAVVGPVVPVKDLDVCQGYQAFFTTLLSTHDGNKALDSLNNAYAGNRRYVLSSSEHLFLMAFKRYKTYCEGAELKKRSHELYERAIKEHPELVNADKEMLIKFAIVGLSNTREHFDEFKKHYFMHDLYKDNIIIFNPTYELISHCEDQM